MSHALRGDGDGGVRVEEGEEEEEDVGLGIICTKLQASLLPLCSICGYGMR